MKLVVIAGSPRKNGNSNSLMRLAVEGARERGAEVEVFFPKDMDINGCLGCDHCQGAPDATCVQKDDMHRVYAAIKDCDALLLASPVYFYALSSWLKKALDRCYALITPDPAEGETAAPPRVAPGKGFYLITTQGDEWPMVGYQILSTVANGLRWIGMERRGELIGTELGEASDWKARDDLIAAARALVEA
jgi:multimeric flavodoxin WrbA